MEFSLYLLIGLAIAGLLALRANWLTLILSCLYWLIVTAWTAGLSKPFYFDATSWLGLFNIKFAYQADGLSNLFLLLISALAILVLLYAWAYAEKTSQSKAKLLSLLQLFAISMTGVVLADDMIMLYLGWELTSVVSYLLIQFDTKDKTANQAALNSLLVSVIGGLVLLVGFIFLHQLSHTWSIQQSIKIAPIFSDKATLSLVFLLLLCGVVTKSAQFPFYFWLTGAMKAPTPVSAYLHSATMVNAGIYLLARFHPLFSPLQGWWYPLLSSFGMITMVISSVLSIFQNDLKAILAYTTIFALGMMVYLLGGNNPVPIEAFAIFLLFHGFYKAAAFMLVGIIDKQYHSRQLDHLRGVALKSPLLALNLVIIFGAMAGIPPFFGFTVKQLIYEAKLSTPPVSYFLIGMGIVSSMLIAAASFRCLWYLFKPAKQPSKEVVLHKQLPVIFIYPSVLTGCILLFSAFDRYINWIVEPATKVVLAVNKLATITPNVRISFMLSLLTTAGGLALLTLTFLFKQSNWRWLQWLELRSAFELTLNMALRFGQVITRLTQGQAMLNQLRIFFIGLIVCLLSLLMIKMPLSLIGFNTDFTFTNGLVCCLLIVSSFSLLASHKFLNNLISLSLVGLSASFFFLVNGAVDVAMTQLLVEVLTIIILLVALRSIKLIKHKQSKIDRGLNGAIALIFGLLITHLLFALRPVPLNPQLQQFYGKNSLLIAQGKNIVNVILVDFRSLDTLGEAMVILATAIGVALLLKKYINLKRENYVNHR